ncbi:MAG: hypothetical protein L0Z53_15025 [Acidobacteriales bacterium]|nr:hypothetical protein [Terriglobales bacterium]
MNDSCDSVIAVHWNDATQHSGYYSGEAALELLGGDGGTMVSVGDVIPHQ